MNNETEGDNKNIQHASFHATFKVKSFRCHAHDIVVHYWLEFLAWFIGLISVAWLIVEAGSYFLGWKLIGFHLPVALIILCFLVICFWTVTKYIRHCPDGFCDESAEVKQLAQLMPAHWEAKLAKCILKKELLSLQRKYEQLANGQLFVPATKRSEDIHCYKEWTLLRLQNSNHMLEVFSNVVLRDFVQSIYIDKDKNADPVLVRDAVYRIVEFQSAMVDYEYDSLSVLPPEGYEELYKMQLGWSGQVRDGVSALLSLLDDIIGMDVDSNENTLEYKFVLGETPEMVACGKRMGELFNELGD